MSLGAASPSSSPAARAGVHSSERLKTVREGPMDMPVAQSESAFSPKKGFIFDNHVLFFGPPAG